MRAFFLLLVLPMLAAAAAAVSVQAFVLPSSGAAPR